MTHTSFVIAAFGVTSSAMAWLIFSSYLDMRRSEALADDLRNQL